MMKSFAADLLDGKTDNAICVDVPAGPRLQADFLNNLTVCQGSISDSRHELNHERFLRSRD